MENKALDIPHDLELKNRKDLHMTAINEVVSATTTAIHLKSVVGLITIIGNNLKIKNLNHSDKFIDIEGEINEIKYNQKKKKILQKVFK